MNAVVFEDKHILVSNKKNGIPSVPDHTGDEALIMLMEEHSKQKLFPINRLDRPTSGLTLFAKSKKISSLLSEQFVKRKVSKEYLAMVSGRWEEKVGSISNYLKKDSLRKRALIIDVEKEGYKKALTDFQLLGNSDNYSLLCLIPHTGRFHQIRAQLAHMGFPIKGDVKYGARRANRDRSIHLHSWTLTFSHPVTGKSLKLEAPLPNENLWNFARGLLSEGNT